MVDLQDVWSYTPPRPKKFNREKDTYNYFKKAIGFEGGFKIYSPVLRGFPDFIVTRLDNDTLLPGFYEVKFAGRPLRPTQISVLSQLVMLAPVYVANVDRDGTLTVRRLWA